MSASLVGSEMCIRDSSLIGSSWSLVRLLQARAPPSRRWPRGGRGSLRGCLLYTSDAADDM
eukprot:8572906-Alexandrium_andersonii.AAC.1